MDAINSLTRAALPQVPTLPAPTGQGAGVAKKEAARVPASEPAPDLGSEAMERRRVEIITQAAQIANVYVVSDRRFTIFKDTTGQYITRFTSLRDGKVTYIPEPDMAAMIRSHAGSMPHVMELQV